MYTPEEAKEHTLYAIERCVSHRNAAIHRTESRNDVLKYEKLLTEVRNIKDGDPVFVGLANAWTKALPGGQFCYPQCGRKMDIEQSYHNSSSKEHTDFLFDAARVQQRFENGVCAYFDDRSKDTDGEGFVKEMVKLVF
jgi:hypothetical protein